MEFHIILGVAFSEKVSAHRTCMVGAFLQIECVHTFFLTNNLASADRSFPLLGLRVEGLPCWPFSDLLGSPSWLQPLNVAVMVESVTCLLLAGTAIVSVYYTNKTRNQWQLTLTCRTCYNSRNQVIA